MRGKSKFKRRDSVPDAKFGSLLFGKFINKLMYDGKKSIAEKIFYAAFDLIEERSDQKPDEYFMKAFDNIKPDVEVKSRRVGGATYQVPVEVRKERREALAIRWLIRFSRSRSGKSMAEKLAGEIMDAYKKQGGAFKKRDETHRMAESNRAFAVFRW